MEQQRILEELTQIFRQVFDNGSLVLHRELTARDVGNWDSLGHLDMIGSVEQHFKIKFSLMQVAHLANVGELLDLISRKLEGPC